MFVLGLPGWENSIGVNEEIEIAKDMGIPVFLLSAGEYRIARTL
jgi:hypothetical protein